MKKNKLTNPSLISRLEAKYVVLVDSKANFLKLAGFLTLCLFRLPKEGPIPAAMFNTLLDETREYMKEKRFAQMTARKANVRFLIKLVIKLKHNYTTNTISYCRLY